MTRKILGLSFAILLGLILAAVAISAPAQAAKTQAGPGAAGHEDPPGEDVYGVVDTFPDRWVGSWTVGGVAYTATKETRFRMFAGPFYTGACVHVRYDSNSYTAYVIETQSPSKCDGSARSHIFGLIEQVPAGYTETIHSDSGITMTWVISGMEFISTPATHFDTHEGPLAVGACAEVKYRVVQGANLADEISSEGLYHCIGPVSYNQAFGYLVTYPPDLLGAWVISDTTGVSLTFMTSAATRLMIGDLPLESGDCVGVKYYTDQGINTAVLVATKDGRYCKGQFKGKQPLSKIFAAIDALPTGALTGTWTLAGVNFTATQATRFEEEEGPFEIGACAEGKYDPSNGAMLFYRLESEEDGDCQARDGSALFKLYGVIEVMPATGLTGTWQVSGVTFEATSGTEVEKRHGSLATGAYVKVYFTYDSTTGGRTAQVIKTHVAPGYGRINFRGHFGGWHHNPSPSGDQLIVDGKSYDADPDIDLPDSLQNGDLVWVNAYQDSEGTFVTQVSLDQTVYAPLISHK